MLTRNTIHVAGDDEWEEPAPKRLKASRKRSLSSRPTSRGQERDGQVEKQPSDGGKEKSITIASTAKHVPQTVSSFLARHIPNQYAPLGSGNTREWQDPNSKYCYRHRPDMLCRRQADEPTMDKLQKELETLSQEDQQGIVQVWSLFSAAPSRHRNLMLQGVLAQCCFPQLSYLSTNVRDLIRIDFLSALPPEVAFRILCFLDTTSLCKAAQVSRKWRQLADDDVVWHRMCEQHIDRKCTKCGWGLPLLERKRLRATKRQIQLRATGLAQQEDRAPSTLVEITDVESTASDNAHHLVLSDIEKSSDGRLSPVSSRQPLSSSANNEQLMKTRPWKDVYKDRFKVGTNWKYGRCSTKIFKGHSNGVMALQFYDNILATGSYDATIKIWDIETGEELRTLSGHTKGVRCLQFDDTKLISGSLDKSLKVWNWRTGECISTFHGHSEGVVSLHFDSNILVSGSIDRTAKVWNFKDKSTFTLKGHADWVNSVRIDSASRTVFTASDDCTVKLWDLDTRKCLRTFEGHVGQVQQILLLPPEFEVDEDNDVGADDTASHTDHTSEVGSSTSGTSHVPLSSFGYQVLAPLPSSQQSTTSTCKNPTPATFLSHFRPGSRSAPPKYMLTGSLDSTIRLWDVISGRCMQTFFGHVEGVWALAADTLRIVSGAEDRMVKVWDPRTGKCERTFTGHAGPVTCVGLSDSRMCSGGEDGEVRMYSFS